MIANGILEVVEQEDGVYVYPNSEKFPPTWALYMFNNGHADLYTRRANTGAVLGKPIKLYVPDSDRCYQTCMVRLGAEKSTDFTGGFRSRNSGRMCGAKASHCIDLSEMVFVEKDSFFVWMCPEHERQSKSERPCDHIMRKVSNEKNTYVCIKCSK